MLVTESQFRELPEEAVKAAVNDAILGGADFAKGEGYRAAVRWRLLAPGPEHAAESALVPLDPRAVLARAWWRAYGQRLKPDDGPRKLTGQQLQSIFETWGMDVEAGDAAIGALPGVPIGTEFEDRKEASRSGVHTPPVQGISGNKSTGAHSIVLSGMYEDDVDEGAVVIYTGEGGKDPNSKRQVRDQELTQRGNAALAASSDRGLPVRVLRGAGTECGPKAGYRYDGLYRVEHYWMETGRSGFRICRYRLIATDGPFVEGEQGAEAPDRKAYQVQRIVRSSAIVDQLKKDYDHTCQVCQVRLETQVGGYSEGAHIKPLGNPHKGPDTRENLLCLCANCHVQFDKGAFVIDEDLQVRWLVAERPSTPLVVSKKHVLSADCLEYHRGLFDS